MVAVMMQPPGGANHVVPPDEPMFRFAEALSVRYAYCDTVLVAEGERDGERDVVDETVTLGVTAPLTELEGDWLAPKVNEGVGDTELDGVTDGAAHTISLSCTKPDAPAKPAGTPPTYVTAPSEPGTTKEAFTKLLPPPPDPPM